MTIEYPLLYLDTTGDGLWLGIQTEPGTAAMAFYYQSPIDSQRAHSSLLIPTLQAGLAQLGLTPGDLRGLAVNVGPGSFTGVRVGISTVRTMAQFLHLPVYAFNTFELLAACFWGQTVAVYLDARRGSATHAVLRIGAQGPVFQGSPQLIAMAERPALPPVDCILASAALPAVLQTAFPGDTVQAVEMLAWDPLQQMQRLIDQNADPFLTPWPDVLPMYLQQPNITLKLSS